MKLIVDCSLTGRRAAQQPNAGPPAFPLATGGTETVITQGGKFYRVHTFLSSGTLTVTREGKFEYLVIGGGGGGGGRGAGGGGAGEVYKFVAGEAHNTAIVPIDLAIGTHSIVVGLGGNGGANAAGENGTGQNGQNTTAFGIEALGGSGGTNNRDAPDGGSGGGSGEQNNASGQAIGSGLGNNGAIGANTATNRRGGGGGGAVAVGEAGDAISSVVPGRGGAGVLCAISGADEYYAGGGAGSHFQDIHTATGGIGGGGDSKANGENGRGGGGGGGTSLAGNAGSGGSGIVIIRYEITEADYNAEAA